MQTVRLRSALMRKLVSQHLADPDWQSSPVKTTVEELKLGEAFTFRGQRYVKSALAVGEDARGWASVFLGVTVVEREETSVAEVTVGEDEVRGAGE